MTGQRNLMRYTFTIQKQRFGRFLRRYASTKLIYVLFTEIQPGAAEVDTHSFACMFGLEPFVFIFGGQLVSLRKKILIMSW